MILTFVLSSLIGGVVGIVLIASRGAELSTAVPFGTMLAAAALVASLRGDESSAGISRCTAGSGCRGVARNCKGSDLLRHTPPFGAHYKVRQNSH